MKLVSHRVSRLTPAAQSQRRQRFPLTRWIRTRSRLERELFLKALCAILVAAIALYAVHTLAHTLQGAEQSINR